jgi:uncharacterized protein (DUF1499 family)
MLFYHVLTAFNTMDIMSEVVPLLHRTGRHQQDGDYFRSCSTSTTYWPPSTRWKLCQRLFYFNQVLTAINKMEIMSEVVLLQLGTDRIQQVGDYVRGYSTSTKYWPPSASWRLCQRLFYLYHVLIAFNKLEIMSDVVLLLPRTNRLQQVGDYVRGFTWQLKERVKLFTCFIN